MTLEKTVFSDFGEINLTKINLSGRFRLSIWRVRAYFMDVITHS